MYAKSLLSLLSIGVLTLAGPLKLTTVNAAAAASSETKEPCPICLESTGILVRIECGHGLHESCMDQWYSTGKSTCPYCREDVLMKSEKLAVSVRVVSEFLEEKAAEIEEALEGKRPAMAKKLKLAEAVDFALETVKEIAELPAASAEMVEVTETLEPEVREERVAKLVAEMAARDAAAAIKAAEFAARATAAAARIAEASSRASAAADDAAKAKRGCIIS